MGPFDALHDPAWRPLTWTLLHFLWQGLIVVLAWVVLFRLSRRRGTQFRYLLGLAGMFLMAAWPVATFVFLESEARWDEPAVVAVSVPIAIASDMPKPDPLSAPALGEVQTAPAVDSNAATWRLDLAERIGEVQPYLLCGWIAGLTFLSGRLLLGVAGVQRLKRGRTAPSGEIADRMAALAARMGFRAVPRVFSVSAARESIVTGLLRPMVLLPAAWLVEMTPEVLEAVIAHELAHIRRFDLWFNLFQRFLETVLFYHPGVWWLSRRVRLAREMCCDESAAAATGERVVYATALELAARKRLEPAGSLLEVALGVTRMTLLDRVRNVLGLAARHEEGRWWPAAVLALLAPLAVWLVSMAAVTSAEEEKQPAERKEAKAVNAPLLPVSRAKHEVAAFLRIAMQENAMVGSNAIPLDRDRFEIYKNTQAELLRSRYIVQAALKDPKVAKLPSVQRQTRTGDATEWLASRLRISFPNNTELMKVSLYGDNSEEAVVLVNAVVNAYMSEVVQTEGRRKLDRLSELEKLYSVKAQEIREKRERLKQVAAATGTSDSGGLGMREKLALEELTLKRQELAKFRADLRHYEVDLNGTEVSLTYFGFLPSGLWSRFGHKIVGFGSAFALSWF